MRIGKYTASRFYEYNGERHDSIVGSVISFKSNGGFPRKDPPQNDPKIVCDIQTDESIKTGDLQRTRFCSTRQPIVRDHKLAGNPNRSGLSKTISASSRKPILPMKNISLLDDDDEVAVGDFVEISSGVDKGRRGQVIMVTSYLLEIEFGGKQRERKYFSPDCVRARSGHGPSPPPCPKGESRKKPFDQVLNERPTLTGLIIEVPTQISETTSPSRDVSTLGVPSSIRRGTKSRITRRQPVDCEGVSVKSALQKQRVKVILDELHDINEALSKEMPVPPPRTSKHLSKSGFNHMLSRSGTLTTCSISDRSEIQRSRDAPATQNFKVGGMVDIVEGIHKDKSARVTKVTPEAIQVKVTGSSQVSLLSPRWLTTRSHQLQQRASKGIRPDPPSKIIEVPPTKAYYIPTIPHVHPARPNFHNFLQG